MRSPSLDQVALAAAGVVAGEPELREALRQAEEIFPVEEWQILEERPLVRAEDVPPVPGLPPPPPPTRTPRPAGEAVHVMPPAPLPPAPHPHGLTMQAALLWVVLVLLFPVVGWAAAPETGGHARLAEFAGPNHGGAEVPMAAVDVRVRVQDREARVAVESSPPAAVTVTRLEPQAETGEIHRAPPPPGPDPVVRPVPVGGDPPTTYHGAARELFGCQVVPPGSSIPPAGAAGAWLLAALVMACLWLVPANGRKGRE